MKYPCLACLDEALAVATRIQPAKYRSIEVRPVRALDVAARSA